MRFGAGWGWRESHVGGLLPEAVGRREEREGRVCEVRDCRLRDDLVTESDGLRGQARIDTGSTPHTHPRSHPLSCSQRVTHEVVAGPGHGREGGRGEESLEVATPHTDPSRPRPSAAVAGAASTRLHIVGYTALACDHGRRLPRRRHQLELRRASAKHCVVSRASPSTSPPPQTRQSLPLEARLAHLASRRARRGAHSSGAAGRRSPLCRRFGLSGTCSAAPARFGTRRTFVVQPETRENGGCPCPD